MNKNIYVKLFLNSSPLKAFVFFPNKQKNIIVNNENIMSLLVDVLEFVSKSKMDYPITLFSSEVILTNILNEHKDNLKTENKWKDVCNYIVEKNIRLQAYTLLE